MAASTLRILVDHAKKTLAIDGKVACREDVAVTVKLDEELEDLDQLRLRVRYEDRDVAVFPFLDTDEWTSGEEANTYTCVLNLNTEQMIAAFNGCDKASERFLAILDYVRDEDDIDETNVYFGKGNLTILNWNADLTTTEEIDEAPRPVTLFAALEKKVDKVAGATAGNIAAFNTAGGVNDSGVAVSADAIDGDSTNATVPTSAAVYVYVNGALQSKQNALTFDNTPTSGSSNPVTSAGVYTALQGKVDKVSGKGLSTNDYTTAEKSKLAGIESGAKANVQADWNEDDSTSDAFIKNKPEIPDAVTWDDVDAEFDITSTNPIENGRVKQEFDVVKGVTDALAANIVTLDGNITAIVTSLGGKVSKSAITTVATLDAGATQKQIRAKLNELITAWNGAAE